MRCWYSGSHSHQQTIAYHPTPPSPPLPLSLVWLSFLCRSQDRWWSSWLGILCWLVTPGLHLTSITTSNRYRVMTTGRASQGSMVFTHNYLLRGCGVWGTCVPVTTSSTSYTPYNVANITRPVQAPFVFMISPNNLIDYPPSDYKDSCQRSSSFTRRGGGRGEGRKTVKDYFSLARSMLWCCGVYIYLTDSQLRLADISSGHLGRVLDTVISLILSYRQSDQIQTHTFIFQSCGGEERSWSSSQSRFEIISTSGSLLASFF